jgi:hypothetical protein
MNAYMADAIAQDLTTATDLLSSFTPTAWGMETEIPRKSDFGRDQYDGLARVVDPEVVYAALARMGGIEMRPEHYPYDGASTTNRIAEQFA